MLRAELFIHESGIVLELIWMEETQFAFDLFSRSFLEIRNDHFAFLPTENIC